MSSPEALKAMSTWVAAIADNIKNPVAGITAVLDLLETKLDDPILVNQKVGQIRDRLVALNEYVSELADFSRPATVSPTPTELYGVIKDATHAMNLPPSCELLIDVPERMEVSVDAKPFKMMVKALVRNALEAIGSHRVPHLLIVARQLTSGSIALSVEDNGPGMDPDTTTKALEPFFSTKEASTGLGLTIVRKYVDAHAGAVAIDRSPKLGGCRVTLTFPQ